MIKMNRIALRDGQLAAFRAVSFCVVSALSCSAALAQNAIQALTGSVQSGVEVVRIETAEPLTAVPAGFTIQSPARIALDFPGVVNGIGRNAIEIGQGNLRSANVVQAGDRTRVVINLKTSSAYQAKLEGKTLLLVLEAPPSPAAAPAPVATQAQPTTFAPASSNAGVSVLKDIDFRRGTGNAGSRRGGAGQQPDWG